MGTQPKELPPVVLFFGCGDRTQEFVGNNNPFTEIIFGTKPVCVGLSMREDLDHWWVFPARDDGLHMLLDLKPSLSKTQASKWVETQGFERFVRKIILDALSIRLKYRELGERFTAAWCEAVRLVVISENFHPVNSFYVQRVFGGPTSKLGDLFPNAEYFLSKGDRELSALWRTADKEMDARGAEEAGRLVLAPEPVAEAS